MLTARIACTMTVVSPERLKAENTTRTFVQSRSSMGELSVGRTHTVVFADRENVLSNPTLFVVFHSPQRVEPEQRIPLIQVRERLLNQAIMSQDYTLMN